MRLCTVAAIGFALLGIYRWPTGEWLQTDISALLPSASNDLWLARANASAASAYESNLVLMVKGDDRSEVTDVLERATMRLRDSGFIDTQFENSEADKWRHLYEQLYPYRWNLLTAADRADLLDDPTAHLAEFRRKLYSPMGISLAGSLNTDPAGLYRKFLEAAAPTVSTNSIGDDADGGFFEIALFRALPLQSGIERKADFYTIYRELKREAKLAGVNLYATGAPLYSAFGMHSAEEEISTIGLASLLLLVVLLVVVLRSWSAILLTLLCVFSGAVGGLLVTVSNLQQIHIVTLVFGATIIGISADYAFHYLCHSLVPGWRARKGLNSIWTGLSLAFVSSAAAFLSLTLLPFPGIRQIGVFMAGGLLFSFVTVCVLFPKLYKREKPRAELPNFAMRSPLSNRAGMAVLLALGMIALPGIFLLHGKDEIRDFYAVPDSLEDDQNVIMQTLSTSPQSRFLIVRGHDAETLLKTEEQLLHTADTLETPGDAVSLNGITRLIPSIATQELNFSVVRKLIDDGYLATHLDSLGFDSGSRNELLASIPETFHPLRLEEVEGLREAEIPSGIGGFLGCDNGECVSWIQFSGHTSAEAMSELLENRFSVELIDPVSDTNELLTRYRIGVANLLIAGGAAFALLLLAVFGWRVTLSILLLPTISCVTSLAIIGYLHHSYSIINLLALLLIIGVSLDYAIFRAFTPERDQRATGLAIALSSLTSILAFGMLSFSQTPVISAFGQTIAIGLVITYALSWVRFAWQTR